MFGTSSFHLSTFERISRSKLGYVHGICYRKPWINLCKVSLIHVSQYDMLENQFLTTRHHSLCMVNLASRKLGRLCVNYHKPRVSIALLYFTLLHSFLNEQL